MFVDLIKDCMVAFVSIAQTIGRRVHCVTVHDGVTRNLFFAYPWIFKQPFYFSITATETQSPANTGFPNIVPNAGRRN